MSTQEILVTLEDAKLIYRNMEGRATQYNDAGNRKFTVVLPDELAAIMLEDGWNVRERPARDEESEPFYTLEVFVGYKIKKPRVEMITSTSRTRLNEDTIGVLDWADFENVDLVIRAYDWTVGDKTGRKAYLKTMFATVLEDELEAKYGYGDDPFGEED